MTTSAALITLIAAPLIAAAACIVLHRYERAIGLLSATAQSLALLGLVSATIDGDGVEYRLAGWGSPLGIELSADGFSLIMLGMSIAVSFGILVYADDYFRHSGGSDPRAKSRSFYPLFLFTSGALTTVFVSGDLFTWYVTLELLTLAAVGLVGLSHDASAMRAALRYLFAALAASMLYLLGVGIIYGHYGMLDWRALGSAAVADAPTIVAAVLITAAVAIKTALFPFHFWLPGAHSIAPAPVSALLSALVLKASMFIQFRVWGAFGSSLDSSGTAFVVLSTLGAAAVLWGTLQAIANQRAKLMLAYSSVAQVGYFFLAFALLPAGEALFGAAYLMVAHGFAKSAAFLAVGAVMLAAGTDVITGWKGLAQREPALVLALALAGVSLIGLPPSGGFIGKFILISSSIEDGGFAVPLVLLTGGLLSSIYIFKLLGAAMRSDADAPSAPSAQLSPALRWTPLVLASAAILLNFAPALLFGLFESA